MSKAQVLHAIGAAKETNFPQVVMVSSGPGALILLLASRLFKRSVTILAFTGQVQTDDINKEKKVKNWI